MFSDIQRAWALWVLSNQGFAGYLTSTCGYEKLKDTITKKLQNKKGTVTTNLAIRLQNVQLEAADALYVICSRG